VTTNIEVGAVVTAKYKTGRYIAQLLDYHGERVLVKILAVLKHPTQGDLHAPKQTDVALFHRRKALAFQEKTWVPVSTVAIYSGDVLSYSDSLKKAIQTQILELEQLNNKWAHESKKCLEELIVDYQL
jgi:kinase-associated protein B